MVSGCGTTCKLWGSREELERTTGLDSAMMLLLPLLPLLLGCCSAEDVSPLEVQAPSGRFHGKILVSMSGHSYLSFRGIPYALPPVGNRRFARPEPFPTIKKAVLDATEFGPICVQRFTGPVIGQEDCLFLNVFTPLPVQSLDQARQLKKVLVFIHGGGLVMGASNEYLPGDLVTSKNVIVVTFNYRLGFLGFLRGSSNLLPGNQGFWDQLLALQWVKDNIRSFGGDPSDVTISGESAGSFSASVLSISPVAKDLFTKAILLSGMSSGVSSRPRHSNDLLETLSKRAGCGQVRDENIDDVVTCLKQLPADSLAHGTMEDILVFITTQDDILPGSVLDLLASQDYLTKVGFYQRDYIVSVTKEDGYLLTDSYFFKVNVSSEMGICENFTAFIPRPLPVVSQMLGEYQKLFPKLEVAAIALATDSFFTVPSVKFLDAFETRPNLEKQHNAYFVYFDHSPQYTPNKYMIHAFDLAYLFDLQPEFFFCFYSMEFNGGFRDEDFQLKSDYIDLLADFMEHGSTDRSLTRKNLTWPPYNRLTRQHLSFSLNPSVGGDILGQRRFIWENLVPSWIQEQSLGDKKVEL